MKQSNTLILLLTFLFIIISCGSHRVKCTDGRTVTSYSNPEKRFPAFVKSNENTLKGTINILEKIKLADIDASTKSTVTELRDKLNNASSRFEMIAKSAYFQFNQDPCGSNTEYYNILNQMVELEKLRLNLDESVKSGGIGGIDDGKIKNAISNYKAKSNSFIF